MRFSSIFGKKWRFFSDFGVLESDFCLSDHDRKSFFFSKKYKSSEIFLFSTPKCSCEGLVSDILQNFVYLSDCKITYTDGYRSAVKNGQGTDS